MPSTYSNSLRIELIGKGEQAGTWDETTNENLGTLLEAAIAGHVEIALADANYSLTANNGSDDEARHASIKFTGTLTATRTITLPSLKSKMYIFENATNQSLVFDAGGTTRTVVAGDRVLAYVDNSGNVADQITSLAALKITSADIDGGTIDNTPIGGATPAAGAFTTLSSTGNTTLGDAAGDTLTINAQTWSAPNGFAVNTDELVLNASGNLGLNVTPSAFQSGYSMFELGAAGNSFFTNNTDGNVGFSTNATLIGGAFVYKRNGFAQYHQYPNTTGNFLWYTAPAGTAGNTVTFTEGMRLINSRYLKVSNTGTYGSAAGLGNLSTNTSHNFQSDQNNTTLSAINGNTGGAVTNYDSHLATGATGKHFAGYINTGVVFAVAANGDVTNTNNSYGAISDRKLKNLLQKKYGADYYDRFKQIQFWTYTLINDPTNQKMLGVVAQELQDIFPGLVDSTPDTEKVEITDEDGNTTTEVRETGTVTLSVKYSVLSLIAAMITQELQFRLDDLTNRIEALENK